MARANQNTLVSESDCHISILSFGVSFDQNQNTKATPKRIKKVVTIAFFALEFKAIRLICYLSGI